MSTLTNELRETVAVNVVVTKDALKIELADGRSVEAPLTGTRGSSMAALKSAPDGGSSAAEKESTGLIWTRTSASKMFC
jgi:hypothetical protein